MNVMKILTKVQLARPEVHQSMQKTEKGKCDAGDVAQDLSRTLCHRLGEEGKGGRGRSKGLGRINQSMRESVCKRMTI